LYRVEHSDYLKVVRARYHHPNGDPALDIRDVIIPEESITILCGRNGAGKSLLGVALAGLLPRSDVVVELYQNHALERRLKNEELRERSAVVFQHSEHQIVGQSVKDDIAFGLRNLGIANDDLARRVNEAIALCELEDFCDRHPLSLSGGELRRAAIASMIALMPRLLILDEPFSSLDWHATERLWELLIRIRQQGKITLLIITHNLAAVQSKAEWMIILDRGTAIASGVPRTLLSTLLERELIRREMTEAHLWR